MTIMRKSASGYSLIEICLVLAVLGLISGTFLSAGSVKIEELHSTSFEDDAERIHEALNLYLEAYGHYPCPASYTKPETDANFGRSTDCTAAASIATTGTAQAGAGADGVRIGALPTRTLGLPDRLVYDPWDSRYTYAVVTELATTSAAYDAHNPTVTTGVIQIIDVNGNQIPDDDSTYKTVVPYIVISHGKDRKGGYNRVGNMPVACGTAKDSENCDSDVVFRDADTLDGVSSASANYFDDRLAWRTRKFDTPFSSSAPACDFEFAIVDQSAYVSIDPCEVWTWGRNIAGEHATGAAGMHDTPVEATLFPDDFEHAAFNAANSCYVASDATVWCLGDNAYKQLGDNTTTPSTTFMQIPGLSDVVSVSVGEGHICALKDDASLWCWGRNTYGQIGNNSTTTQATPVQVMTGVKAYEAGDSLTCATNNSDSLYCWGRNTDGQVGNNNQPTDQLTPPATAILTTVVNFSVGQKHVCAIRNNGKVFCWGDGAAGANGAWTDRPQPVELTTIAGATKVDVDYETSVALMPDGTIRTWGYYSSIGDGRTSFAGDEHIPYNPGLTSVKNVGAGDAYICALHTDDTVKCWGFNDYGMLGDGNAPTNNTSVPATPIFP